MNRPRPTAPLLLVLAALCCLLVAGCGDADEPAGTSASTLRQTVAATSKIDSGRLTASVDLEADGLVALSGPIRLRASGPFSAPASGELPRARLAIAASLAGQAFDLTATSTGRRAFVRLGGRDYEVDRETVGSLRRFFGNAGGAGFASLGLDPASWLERPRARGEATVGGVRTERISATIDVRRLLADVAGLLEGGGMKGLLTPKLQAEIAGAVKSAKADIWSGTQDRILRRLAVVIEFAFDEGSSPVRGLDGGRINLRLQLGAVNATEVKVSAPKNPRPLSRLFEDDGLSGLLGGLGAGAAPGGAGDAGEAFLKCVRAAGEDSAAIRRCASKLGP